MTLTYTLQEGDMETQIKWICRQTMAQLISDGGHTASNYPALGGGLDSFLENFLTMVQRFALDEGTDGVKSQGQLTVADNPTEDDTMVIGSITYTFKDTENYAPSSDTATVQQIEIGSTELVTQVNIYNRINGIGFYYYNTLVECDNFDSDNAYLIARTAGTAGDSIATTSSFTSANNEFDATTLGTVAAGVDEVLNATIAAIDTAPAIESWREMRDFAAATFATMDGVINP